MSQHLDFESGISRITELFADECFNESENQLVTRFRIDTSSRNMVRALGALLKYMDAARVGVEYEPLNVQTPVTAVKRIAVGELVEVDSGTYLALDIFSKNEMMKRNVRRRTVTSQSSSSLFTLCNKCRSGPGRQTLRKWFERPTTNLNVLNSRHQAISFFLQYALDRLRSGTAKVRHWENLFKIDFEESYVENRPVMKIGVDPELDRTKQLYRQLPGFLTRIAQEECRRLKAETCSVAYVPLIGYLVSLPLDFPVDEFEEYVL
uniref:MUTSd domain-containing protein n=1 Tax=Angiostrongylus cantonensis TaxID=6313 RepID=A0A0K0DGW1_ANGCA